MPIAVVLDRDDARALVADSPACHAVLALTPAARVELKDAEVPVLTTLPFYTSIGHRRTVLHQRRAIAELMAASADEPGLCPSAEEALIGIVFYLTGASSRLTTTLRQPGPWLVRHRGGWHICARRDHAHALLFQRVVNARFDLTLHEKYASPPLAWLARRASVLAARGYRGKAPIVLGYGRRLLDRLAEEAVTANPRRPVLTVWCTKGTWRDHLRIARSLWRALRQRPRDGLYAIPLPSGVTTAAAERVLAQLSDPAARAAIAISPALPLEAAQVMAGLSRHLEELLSAAAPSTFLSDGLGWAFGGAAGEAARRLGIPVLLLSHSSHSAPTTPTARAATDQWIRRGRVLSRFATTLLPKTPHAMRAAEAARTAECLAPQAPFVWLQPAHSPRQRRDVAFQVLHACNFSPWAEHVPWAMQTSDEFVNGIEILAAVVGDMADTRLVVRPKDKAECNAAVLEALLPARPNVTFRHEGPFAPDLADADLVVSFSSSTIEEALHQRTPVLLWGGGVDYCHLPARKEPPSCDDRAAVYVATSQRSLEVLLPAIAAAHRDRPLRDVELHEHVWPSGTPDWRELARRLARGDAAIGPDYEEKARMNAEESGKAETRVATQ